MKRMLLALAVAAMSVVAVPAVAMTSTERIPLVNSVNDSDSTAGAPIETENISAATSTSYSYAGHRAIADPSLLTSPTPFGAGHLSALGDRPADGHGHAPLSVYDLVDNGNDALTAGGTLAT